MRDRSASEAGTAPVGDRDGVADRRPRLGTAAGAQSSVGRVDGRVAIRVRAGTFATREDDVRLAGDVLAELM